MIELEDLLLGWICRCKSSTLAGTILVLSKEKVWQQLDAIPLCSECFCLLS